MPSKIKFLLAFLGVSALISVLMLTNVLKPVTQIDAQLVLGEQEVNYDISPDEDLDGLSNSEESYWNTDFKKADTDGDGFVDGEEVASGHDPLIPGPDDLLLNRENLTDTFSQLTVAGLAEGSLRAGSPDQAKSLSVLADTIIEDGLLELRKSFDPTKIEVIPSNQTTEKEYIEALGRLIHSFSEAVTSEMGALAKILEAVDARGFKDPKVIEFFDKQTASSEKLYEEVVAVKAPDRYRQAHITLARSVHETILINATLADANQDPLKAYVALNRLVDILFTEIVNMVSSYTKLADRY